MSEVALYIEDLWKRYKVGSKKSSSLRESLMNIFNRDELNYFWALQDINFEVKKGEAIGIIGRNGAGKSTLLKVLSKITYPTKGRVEINGRVSSLLEVGTGFHPELSGRQNIFLNGTILGMTRKEINQKFDEIVAFSGVEKFIDTPVKHYSSGMKVRLAFSVAAHLEPEILIIDEVLAVGDAEFQKKCLGKMEDVTGEGRTVLFVSHNMGAVKSLCNSGILLDSGRLAQNDKIDDIVTRYLTSGMSDSSKTASFTSLNKVFQDEIHCFNRFSLVDENGTVLNKQIGKNTKVYIEIEVDIHEIDPSFNLGYALNAANGETLYWSFCKDASENEWPEIRLGKNIFRSEVPMALLNESSYSVEYVAALHRKKWLFEPGRDNPKIQFEVGPGKYASPLMSATKRKGVLMPIFNWKQIR